MKTKKKPAADEIVIVAVGHANERGAFSRGERIRAGTPELDLSLTVPDGTPQSEWPSPYDDEDPPPAEPDPRVIIQSIEIPAHRPVISQVDLAEPARWAPGWIGEKAATRPPPFARSVIKKGQMVDVLSPTCARTPAPSAGPCARSRPTTSSVSRE
ncbi:MAG TPA: hypothetical protein VLC09_08795 [Polyangiaceae bacterium]|nr:hypothetical protein [Polyangiaceae bacterium]